VEWVVAQSLKTRTLVAAQLFAAYMFSDQTSQAIAVAKARPTLIFIGQPWAEKAVPFIKRLLPESKYVVFGGSAMFWEHPDAFNQVLDEFIRQNVGVYLQG
jgi:hypothetical protein